MPSTAPTPAALSVAPGQMTPPGRCEIEHEPDGVLRESRWS
jgi:hypothetical protein